MTPVRRALLFIVHLLYGAFAVWYVLPRYKPAERGVVVTSWARRGLGHIERADCGKAVRPPGAVTSTLFVCNHVSWLDILALLAVRPMRFVAKSEVRSWPMIGWMAMKTGTVFLRRNECRHLAQVKRTIESALAHGGCIATFPEATTTDGITVRPFHSGLFESAVVSGATVWPVALRYHHSDGSLSKEAAFIGDQSLVSSLRQILRQPVLNLAVSFGSPIAADGWERQELAAAAYRAVTDMLKNRGNSCTPNWSYPCRRGPRSNWRSFPSLGPNLPSLAVRLRQYPETATNQDSGFPRLIFFSQSCLRASARL